MLPKLLLRNSSRGYDKNLCFANAAVQILRNIPFFKHKVAEHQNFSVVQKELKSILDNEGSAKSVSAHSLRQKVGERCHKQEMYSGQQNDSLEFLEYLLQCLDPSVASLFGFRTRHRVRYIISGLEKACPICGHLPPESDHNDRVLKIGFPEFGDVSL